MAKRSIFRDFVTALRRRWKTEVPWVQPARDSHGLIMPRSSTFHAGVSKTLGLHVFINFQHSCMAWQVGQFTVNIILSHREGPPERPAGPFAPKDGLSFSEGSYRIGFLLGTKDKWWHLNPDADSIILENWRPSSYDDRAVVIDEAVSEVTRDVLRALEKLGVSAPPNPQ